MSDDRHDADTMRIFCEVCMESWRTDIIYNHHYYCPYCDCYVGSLDKNGKEYYDEELREGIE